MKAICGADCSECELFKNKKCQGCPYGNKECWIAKYIKIGGKENYEEFKKKLIDEINSLNVEGMPMIDNLYPLHGSFVNLEYPLPNGKNMSLLNDDEAYLGNQVECIFNDEDVKKCFGIVANTNFIIISEYEENGINPEIVIFKRRS